MNTSFRIDTIPEEFAYQHLSYQNLPFHNACAELIDNAISWSPPPTTVDVLLEKLSNTVFQLAVADEGEGISLDSLRNCVFKLGGIRRHLGNVVARLNEHGWGLKNALCSLTENRPQIENQPPFTILTRDTEAVNRGVVYVVNGPFRRDMDGQIVEYEKSEFENFRLTPNRRRTGTVVVARCLLPTVQTVAKGVPGPRPTDVGTVAKYLQEHLGVFYRGLLSYSPSLEAPPLRINLYWRDRGTEWERTPVTPVEPRYAFQENHRFEIQVDGKTQEISYTCGILDKVATNTKIYYKGNLATQGVDIQINGRTVATHWFDEIWAKQVEGVETLVRHPEYNDFVGEIRIQTPPEDSERFRTLFNKTSFDERDPWWEALQEKMIREFRPPRRPLEQRETELRNRLKAILERHAGTRAETNFEVWESIGGIRVDVCEITRDKQLKLHEIKVGTAQPIDVYQVRLYWDGAVADGKSPIEARLIAKEIPESVRELVRQINTQHRDARNRRYNITCCTLEEAQLILPSEGGVRTASPSRRPLRRRR
jgi:hypothetical protein